MNENIRWIVIAVAGVALAIAAVVFRDRWWPERPAPEAETQVVAAPEQLPPPEEEAAPPIEEGALEGAETPLPEEAAIVPMKTIDLERWERKALKSLKRFHTAAVRFESTVIPLEEQSRISVALRAAQTAEDVRAAFKAEDVDDLIDGEWGAALDWARKVETND